MDSTILWSVESEDAESTDGKGSSSIDTAVDLVSTGGPGTDFPVDTEQWLYSEAFWRLPWPTAKQQEVTVDNCKQQPLACEHGAIWP